MSRESGCTRRDFLKTAAVAAGLTCGLPQAAGGLGLNLTGGTR
jgi:hypothetical protein